jgi:hypothetical protein
MEEEHVMAVIARSMRIIEATEAWVEALRGKTMLEANEARDALRAELVEVDRLEEQLAGAVEENERLRAGIRGLQRRFEARERLHTSDFTRIIVGGQ